MQIWAWQWKMKFNTEKTEEVISSAKGVKPIHPPLSFGNDDVARMSEHKHLGMILDSKLDFQSHRKEAIQKARQGIGITRFLSNYVSRCNVLSLISWLCCVVFRITLLAICCHVACFSLVFM